MLLIKRLLLILAIIVTALLLWIFVPWPSEQVSLNITTDTFVSESWQQLDAPVVIASVGSYGRANPFAEYEAVENELERDEIRMQIIDQARAGLQRFFDARGVYPIGEDIEIGSGRVGCLSALGWVSEEVCAVPANPAANIQYARNLQGDPGIFSIVYSRDEDQQKYTINFTLETDEILGQAGGYVATEEGIRKLK